MKIFVLNLARATQRRALMESRLAELGLEGEILPAIEGAHIPPAELPAGTEPGLSPGEIGCYLSHVRFWQTVVERKLPHAMILEDDVILDPQLMEVADEIAALDLPCEAVRLSSIQPVRGLPVAALSGGRRLILPNKNPSGTQGYLVSLAGARRLLASLSIPKMPIDNALDAYWKQGLAIPVVFPCVVREDPAVASDIVGRYRSDERKTLGRHLARVFEAQRRKITVFLLARRVRAFGAKRADRAK